MAPTAAARRLARIAKHVMESPATPAESASHDKVVVLVAIDNICRNIVHLVEHFADEGHRVLVSAPASDSWGIAKCIVVGGGRASSFPHSNLAKAQILPEENRVHVVALLKRAEDLGRIDAMICVGSGDPKLGQSSKQSFLQWLSEGLETRMVHRLHGNGRDRLALPSKQLRSSAFAGTRTGLCL